MKVFSMKNAEARFRQLPGVVVIDTGNQDAANLEISEKNLMYADKKKPYALLFQTLILGSIFTEDL